MGYIDPGSFGLVSQIGYILLFVLVSGFMLFFKPIKQLFNRLTGRKQSGATRDESGDSTQS